MGDDVDKAIDAAAAEAAAPLPAICDVTINATGRPFRLAVPPDLTELEALAIIGYVVSLPERLRKARPSSGLVLPRH